MRRLFSLLPVLLVLALAAHGQSLHFSQYYNAPALINPANTALFPEDDIRLGLNYRTQWSALPVPYNTFSAFTDMKIGGHKDNETHNNWLGLGLAFFNDKAGDGNLSLSQVQANVAYHLQLSRKTMVSVGFSGSTVQRSVNYDNLTFDAQWDGFSFNPQMLNGEKVGTLKTSYTTVAAGFNFAVFPNDNLYIKLGGSMANLNTPTESFYQSKNQVAMRPIGNLDVIIKASPVVIVNPSVYYSTQYAATEIVVGSLLRTVLSNDPEFKTQLILGLFDRLGDAAIGVAGVQLADWQLTASYDMTMSTLAPYNASYGALEFSLIYQRPYGRNREGSRKTYSCPIF